MNRYKSLKLLNSRVSLLYIMAIAMAISSTAWTSQINNFAIEMAKFDGSQIGILQSLREIPGFLAFTVILVIIYVCQQRLTYLSIIALGVGTSLTGFFPTPIGLYITTVIMSIGFHYLETLNQSLSLQWLDKKDAPITLGKITAIKSFTTLFVLIFIYLLIEFLDLEYKYIYMIFGGMTILIGIFAWTYFNHFKDDVVQEKKIRLKKEYWLYYVLTFLAGARRQIFVVFAGFLLVEKFGVDVHNMVALLLLNSLINMYFAPKIGKFITKFGEAITLKVEYIGLAIVFFMYAYVDSLYFAFALFIIDHFLFSMAIALKTYFQKIADPKDIASASAVSFTINHIAAIFLPIVLGLVWIYSYSLVFIIGVGIAILSLSLAFLIPKEPKQGYETILKSKPQ